MAFSLTDQRETFTATKGNDTATKQNCLILSVLLIFFFYFKGSLQIADRKLLVEKMYRKIV